MSNAIVHAYLTYRHKFYLRPIPLHYLDETATLEFIIRVVDKIQVLLSTAADSGHQKSKTQKSKADLQSEKSNSKIKSRFTN